MGSRIEGNGGSRVTILAHDKGPGYIILAPDRIDKLVEQTPIHISRALEGWQKDHPSCRVRCAVPIVDKGQTLAIHVWFDQEKKA